MTPTELETYVRQRYNAVGDNFYPQAEIFTFFYDAQMQLALEANCIQNVYQTSTVIDQREYSVPTRSIALNRIEFAGEKLNPNDFTDDDNMTGRNSDELITGRPNYYQRYGTTIYLRPTPSSVDTLKIFSSDAPSLPTATGTLDVPVQYHLYLADYALHCMAFQDKNYNESDRFLNKWKANKDLVLAGERLKTSSDSFNVVKDWSDQVTSRFI